MAIQNVRIFLRMILKGSCELLRDLSILPMGWGWSFLYILNYIHAAFECYNFLLVFGLHMLKLNRLIQ